MHPHSDSLLDWIINNGRSSEHEARPLARQLASTLSLIHAHGVVHRNLKPENILVCLDPTATPRKARKARRCRRAIITDFTFAGVTVPAADSVASRTAPLIARCGQQYNPAPELLRSAYTAQPGAQAEDPISDLYYAGPPVDVWGLGVVLHILVCGRIPFDAPTIDAIHEASRCSPASLHFPRRVSRGVYYDYASVFQARSISALFIPTTTCAVRHPKKDCKDLLRRMLHANPAARASLDEVLKHPWMTPPASRCPRMLSLGTDSDVQKYAALKWPDQVDRKQFDRIAAIESKNGDDAWRSLFHALELVSLLCGPCRSGDSRAQNRRFISYMSRLSRARELPDRALSLLAEIRSRAVLEWFIQVSRLRKRRTKIVTTRGRDLNGSRNIPI